MGACTRPTVSCLQFPPARRVRCLSGVDASMAPEFLDARSFHDAAPDLDDLGAGVPPSTSSEARPIPSLVDHPTAKVRIREKLYGAISGAACVTAVPVTMSGGKSFAFREVVADHPGTRFVAFVPRHDLAEQHAVALRGLGVTDVYVANGPTGMKDADGTPTCKEHERAGLLARLRVDVASHLCSSCKFRSAYPNPVPSGPTIACPAAARPHAGHAARVTIHQGTMAAEIIRALRWTIKDPTARPVLVFDELPPMVNVVAAPSEAVIRDVLASCAAAVRDALLPVVEPVLKAIKAGASRKTLRECIDEFGDAANADEILKAAILVEVALDTPNQKLVARSRLTRAGVAAEAAAITALRMIVEGAAMPNRVLLFRNEEMGPQHYLVARAAWCREVSRWVRDGGRVILLDATVQERELKSVAIGSKAKTGTVRVPLDFEPVHVADMAGCERILYKWGSAARGNHTRNVGDAEIVSWDHLQGVLRHLASIAKKHGGSLGILSDMPTATAIQKACDALIADPATQTGLPREFADLVRSGVEIIIGWYGAHRGLDKWKGVRVHACIGEAFPPVPEVEAMAAFLGEDPFLLGRRLSQAEILQAIGRARSVHYEVAMVHYGKYEPPLWLAPQWKDAERVTGEPGRPKATLGDEGLSEAGHEARRAKLGLSKRDYAKFIGAKYETYRDRTKGVTTPTASTSVKKTNGAKPSSGRKAAKAASSTPVRAGTGTEAITVSDVTAPKRAPSPPEGVPVWYL